jgi:hypothetical protein
VRTVRLSAGASMWHGEGGIAEDRRMRDALAGGRE